MRLILFFAALAVSVAVLGCREQTRGVSPSESRTSPVTPQVPTPEVPKPEGPTPWPTPTLSGLVYEETDHGRRPIRDARVQITDLLAGPYEWYPWYEHNTNNDGYFRATPIPGRAVKIVAYVGVWSSSDLFQLSGVQTDVNGDVEVEIELVRRGRTPRKQDKPRLSGVVFRQTPNGRQPAADMPIMYSSRGHDGSDVYGRTDTAGRYEFYALPISAGYVLTCTGNVNPPPSPSYIIVNVDIRGDTVQDVECQS
jgi:hypothetical protein